jgi:hypothetical protein
MGNVFENCTNLKVAVLGSRVTTFVTFNSLFGARGGAVERVTIRPTAGYTAVGSDAFVQWEKLRHVEMEEGVTAVGSLAFSRTTALESVLLPASISGIGFGAFSESAVHRLNFMGNAPATIGSAAWDGAVNAAVFHLAGATGFTSPTWQGLPTHSMGTTSPGLVWKLRNGIDHGTDFSEEHGQAGVKLLLCYALGLDPNGNLQQQLPRPVQAAGGLSMDFFAGTPGITYQVQTSGNLADWTAEGVVLSAPDAGGFRRATYAGGGWTRFMRLVVND